MAFEKGLALEKVYWANIRDQTRKVNPEFADIIDALNPSEKLYLYRASYAFGTTILKEGIFHLPTKEGRTVSLNHPDVPQKIKEDLGYPSSIPVGLILNGSIEQLLRTEERISPYTIR